MSSEVFESINLESKVNDDLNWGKKSVSLEAFSEGELDPEEFLLSDSPSNMVNSYKARDKEDEDVSLRLLKVTYNNLELFLNPSKILGGNHENASDINQFQFDKLEDYVNNESAINFLTNKNSVLIEELRKNIKNHGISLSKGDEYLNKYRSMIEQNFGQLSELNYSLQELYTNDLNYNQTLYNNFQSWDQRRLKVLSKLRHIKSDQNPHGAKLINLINDSNSIDDEISNLKLRIESLQNKKRILSSEIQKTSSILESKSSKYVEIFKNLEKLGLEAIKEYINLDDSHDIPPTIISKKPIDVSFSRNFTSNNLATFSELLNNLDLSKTRNEPIEKSNKSRIRATSLVAPKDSIIGMKPYIVPDDLNTEEPIVNQKEIQNDLNYGHGPTPFEQGYIQGEYLGQNFKIKMNKFIEKIVKSLPESKEELQRKKPTSIEDQSNLINEKLDYEPIKIILEQKIKALKSLIHQTSQNATIYHKGGVIWQDVIKVLNQQESKLQNQISASILQLPDSSNHFAEILRSTIDQLKSLFDLHNLKQSSLSNGNKFLMLALSNEIKSLCKAFSMVSKESLVEKLYEEFKPFDLTLDK